MSGVLAMSFGGFDLSAGVLSLGVFTGLTYGLLAAGLVLVYRSSRFINFAHGAIGVFGAAVCSLAVRDFGLPYWVAFILGLLVSAGVGATTELAIVKPLASKPKVLSMVATLGTASFLIFTALAINPDGLSGLNFPQPVGMPTLDIGALRVTPAFAAQAILSPVLLAVVGIFLWRSRTGLAIRAAASNADAADTAGVPTRSMSVIAWAIAGAIAAFSVTLIIPTKGVVTPDSLGPELLVRGLAAAAIARFTNYWVAIGVATLIGVVEQVMATNPDAKGIIEVVILAVVIIALLLSRRAARAPLESWGQRSLPSPRSVIRRRPMILRVAPVLAAVAAVAAAVAVPFVATGSQALVATIVVSVAIVGMSVLVVTGLGGQLSLAQFAYAGIGAAISIRASADIGFLGGLIVGAVITALVATLLAVPALRVQGPQLGVASLVFAVVTAAWLLDQSALLGGAKPPVRPDFTIKGITTAESRGYFWIALVALLVVMAIVHRIRSGAWGRVVVAVRDNAEAARALSISATSIRLQTAAVGGFIAGIGGAIYGFAFSNIGAVNFPVQSSIDAVTATVIGGLGSLVGPLIGAAYLIGIPQLFSLSPEASTALAGAWLILIVNEPGGVSGLVSAVVRRLERRGAPTTSYGEAGGEADAMARMAAMARDTSVSRVEPRGVSATGAPILVVDSVTKRYGGVTAVNAVSLAVQPGEIVGLIGPNGAGKTTLFEIISGFVRPDEGRVTFLDRDVTTMSPENRSRLGMARSFQSAALFPTLSLTESIMVANERTRPSSIVESLGRQRLEREREDEARTLVRQFGLDRYADALIGSLPTGTRRLAELACSVALEPTLILLDEPSAGIAHSETEHLAAIIAAIRDELGITLVIIEHDLPMLTELCDRMVALEIGAKISEGTPAEVRAHPAVIASYVGADA